MYSTWWYFHRSTLKLILPHSIIVVSDLVSVNDMAYIFAWPKEQHWHYTGHRLDRQAPVMAVTTESSTHKKSLKCSTSHHATFRADTELVNRSTFDDLCIYMYSCSHHSKINFRKPRYIIVYWRWVELHIKIKREKCKLVGTYVVKPVTFTIVFS